MSRGQEGQCISGQTLMRIERKGQIGVGLVNLCAMGIH